MNEELTTPKSVLRSKRSRDVTKRVLFPSQDVTLSPKQPQNPGAVSTRAAFPSWTEREELALICFMLLYTEGTSWSSRSGKGDRFWEKAGGYISLHIVEQVYIIYTLLLLRVHFPFCNRSGLQATCF